MSPPVPSMDIDGVFQLLYDYDPHSDSDSDSEGDIDEPYPEGDIEKPYPEDDIKSYGNKMAKSVLASHDQLQLIYTHHEELLHKRWPKKLQKHRRELLLSAWPNMAESHRPESFEKGIYHPCALSTGVPPEEHLWPYINLEDLQDKVSLLLLLDTRSRNPPHTFAMTERVFMPLGQLKDSRAPLQKMQLGNRDNYGSIVVFDTREKATDFEDNAKGLNPGAGLQVLYVQDRLLKFLLKCCEALLHDCNLQTLTLSVNPGAPSRYNQQQTRTTFAEVAAKAPYRARHSLDFVRLCYLTSAMAEAAQDDVWQLRENPGYFAEAYQSTVDHRTSQIPDQMGRTHPATGTPEFVLSILHDLVARSHYMLIFWDQLAAQAKIIEELFETNPGGIDVEELKPFDLVAAVMSFHILLESIKRWVVGELRLFVASPPLRNQWTRNPFDQANSISASAAFSENPLKKDLSHLLEEICGDINGEKIIPFSGIQFLLDILETFLRNSPGSRDLISPQVEKAITRLSVLADCSHQLEMPPWGVKVYASLAEDEKTVELVQRLSEPFRAWDHIFQAAMEGGFISSSKLGNPSDGKFNYPSYESKSKKKTIDALCAAEAKLDIFWSDVDSNLRKLSGVHEQKTFQRLLDERGEMRRTKPWSQRSQLETSQPLLSSDIYDSQPVSKIFHDSSAEITGRFDMFAVSEKVKEKTRGMPVAAEAAEDPACDSSPDPSPQFHVNHKTYRVFKALFHVPDDKDPPDAVKWTAFVQALIGLGFSVEQLHGSAWQFTPSSDLGLDRGISFHEPHPEDGLPLTKARKYGARLTRAYGWDGSMFKEK